MDVACKCAACDGTRLHVPSARRCGEGRFAVLVDPDRAANERRSPPASRLLDVPVRRMRRRRGVPHRDPRRTIFASVGGAGAGAGAAAQPTADFRMCSELRELLERQAQDGEHVVFIPCRLSDSRPLASRNLLSGADERAFPARVPWRVQVMVVVDTDQFEDGQFQALEGDPGYVFLVLPPRRGVPFARHMAKVLADALGMRAMYFRDDDVVLHAPRGADAGPGGQEARVALAAAMGHLERVWEQVRCRYDAAAAGLRRRPAVVGTCSSRHRKWNLRRGVLLPAPGVRFSLCVDFRFVRLDLEACRAAAAEFLPPVACALTRREWAALRERRDEDAVQRAFFQGEDFGLCEQLAARSQRYSQAVCTNCVYADSVDLQQASEAGTRESGRADHHGCIAAGRWCAQEYLADFAPLQHAWGGDGDRGPPPPRAAPEPVGWATGSVFHHVEARQDGRRLPGRGKLHAVRTCGGCKNMRGVDREELVFDRAVGRFGGLCQMLKCAQARAQSAALLQEKELQELEELLAQGQAQAQGHRGGVDLDLVGHQHAAVLAAANGAKERAGGLNVPAVRAILAANGLSRSGTSAEIRARLLEIMNGQAVDGGNDA